MSPLVRTTAIQTFTAQSSAASKAPICTATPLMADMIVANDTESPAKRSILERRRKRQNRRAVH